MSELTYTDPERVVEYKRDEPPRGYVSVTGYGPKVPGPWMIRYVGDDGRRRWHRVYFMVYGNSGSAYIIVGGRDHHLDLDTEYRIESIKEATR